MKRILLAAIVAFVGLTALVPQLSLAPETTRAEVAPLALSVRRAQLPAGLRVQGVSLVNAAGERFIVSGMNLETWRDKGCQWVTDGEYPARALFAQTLKNLNVNYVRFNYSYAWLNEAGNLDKFMDFAQEFVNRGIYVMPSDHTYTGKTLVNSAAIFPMFKRIVDAFRARGIEQWLIINPFNEPFGDPDSDWNAWLAAQKNVLTYLRTTAAFDGVVALDTKYYALQIDTAIFDKVMAHDASLRGSSNVVFSLHYYPTNGMSPVDAAFAISDKYPMMSGEVGQYNASPIDPQYVKDVISKWFSVAWPKGHNGLINWIGAWCDSGKSFEDWVNPAMAYSDPLVLTSYGKLWRDNYFSKLPNSTVPPPQPTIIVQNPSPTPTRSVVATNTPRTRTATPVSSPTALMTAAPTRTPAPDALEVYVIQGKVGGLDVDITITRLK